MAGIDEIKVSVLGVGIFFNNGTYPTSANFQLVPLHTGAYPTDANRVEIEGTANRTRDPQGANLYR